MKRVILMLVFSLLPGMLFAETVMLFTRMHPAESQRGANYERFVAVEDGVEDQFFSAGHIIFDAGLPRAIEHQRAQTVRTDTWARQTAKAGGANFLLIVNLEFPNPQKALPLPRTASYRFISLKDGMTLAHGSVDTSAIVTDLKSKKPYDLCFALGKRIAENALGSWKPSS